MSQTKMSGRERALERRKAMSTAGKRAIGETNPGQGRGRAKPAPVAVQRGSQPKPKAVTSPARSEATATAPRRRTRPVQSASTARSASLQRRQAMSTRGKIAVSSTDRIRIAPEKDDATAVKQVAEAGKSETESGSCSCGCKKERRSETRSSGSSRAKRAKVPSKKNMMASGRAQSLARRQALSSRGKAGLNGTAMSAAQTARVTNPELSGRELARALRDQRSKRGRGSEQKCKPTGKIRPALAAKIGGSQDAPWKVGATETTKGQTVTGTMTGRSPKTTGDESSTCREVTGTEYMGADVFREFCETDPAPKPAKVRKTSTFSGNAVTGNEVGRSTKVTGDEPGTCKNITGTQYVSTEQEHGFCANVPQAGPAKVSGSQTMRGETVTGAQVGLSGKVTGNEPGAGRALTGSQYLESDAIDGAANVTRSGGQGQSKGGQPRTVPKKVGVSDTLRGGSVTGTLVGRRSNMTGDEPGSCRNITGDDYVGKEQYQQFCDAAPAPTDNKVGVSATTKGERVTGTQTGRANRVTGDEPGTCKSVTGTPYAGAEQYAQFCDSSQAAGAQARAERPVRRAGSVMTGIQPGIGGQLTGAGKGACESPTGTPYVGDDQMAAACPSNRAEPGSPDFPQPLDSSVSAADGQSAGAESWGDFSVQAPQHATREVAAFDSVTGGQGPRNDITGPFGMASGKVTGTEEARFPHQAAAPAAAGAAQGDAEPASINGRVKPRISGEGQDAGVHVTGDDWDRNERVTGTEGTSALVRNPSRRGAIGSAMPAPVREQRPEAVPAPVSKVTGSSGNTENGSLITYSGGARG